MFLRGDGSDICIYGELYYSRSSVNALAFRKRSGVNKNKRTPKTKIKKSETSMTRCIRLIKVAVGSLLDGLV